MKTKLINSKKQEELLAYDALKIFQGQYYKGIKVGGHHKWYYDQGEWKETKKTPDLWEFKYQVKKRRAGKAPKGSGVPLGTEYHWLILGHQIVQKLDENVYNTEMNGLKYKVAYKKSGQERWSSSIKGQRKRVMKLLEQVLLHLKKEELQEENAQLMKKKTKKIPNQTNKRHKAAFPKPGKLKN